jgi:hypothetical protein
MELVYQNDLLSIDDLAAKLWNEPTRATREPTILLLRLTAAAHLSPTEAPLIPHRLRFLVRAPQGLSACLDPQCPGPAQLRAEGIGCLQTPRDRCAYCNAITLPVHRCKACGYWALAGFENLVSDSAGKDLSVVVVNAQTGKYFGRGAGICVGCVTRRGDCGIAD